MGLEEVQDVTMTEEELEDGEDQTEEDGRNAEKEMPQIKDHVADGQQESAVSSDASSDDDDLESDKQVEKLEESVTANPYNYEAHVQLISSLRRAGLLEKLRAARESMNLLYPLAPTMWAEWAQDEARLASGAEDVRAVEAVYERGIQEYLSVTLWLEYLKFVEEHDATVLECTTEGVSKIRRLYERALAAVGLHFAEGGKIWEAYREFEQALLMILNDSGAEGKVKQVEIVRNLFRRQLTVPLANLTDTLEEYREWENQQGICIGDEADSLAGLPPHVCSAYKKAQQLCNVRELHEEKIAKGKPGEAELLQHYLGYCNIEEATGDPARAQVVYERAVSAFPVSQDVWMKYTHYLETNLKVPSVLKGVYARAVRNCPWVEPLWKSYLLALERFHADDNELSAVFEQSLQGGFQTAQEYLDLFLTRCDGLRRRIMVAEDTPNRESNIALLHNTFDRASQFMSTYYPDFVDRSLQLHAYWADMEAHVAKDLAAARGVWEGLIKSSGWMPEVWQGYILMELSLKNFKEARAIYRSCYSRRLEGNGTELMCSAWLRFEREHGSLEDYDRAVMKVGPRLAEVQSMQLQQEAKFMPNVGEGRSTQGPTDGKRKATEQLGSSGESNTQVNASDSISGKRKRALGFKEPKPVLKRPKSVREEEKQKPVTSQNPGSKGDEDKTQKESLDPPTVDMGQAHLDKSRKPKLSRQYKDECTAFVSNLSFEVTEEQLKTFFSSVAGVKEVRLLREKPSGRSRGLAYVDFEDDDSLTAAIKKDKEELGGRQLSIARSAPTRGRGGGRFKAGRGDPGRGSGRGRGEESRGQSSGRGARGLGSALGHRRGGKVNVTGSTTFAVPRTVVRPLGWNPGQAAVSRDEVPKSNDEFRKILLTKQ